MLSRLASIQSDGSAFDCCSQGCCSIAGSLLIDSHLLTAHLQEPAKPSTSCHVDSNLVDDSMQSLAQQSNPVSKAFLTFSNAGVA